MTFCDVCMMFCDVRMHERRHSHSCSSYLLSKQRTAQEEKGPHDQGNRPVFAVMSSESDVL